MLRVGQTLGAYRIETILGRGAMGVVYRGVGIDDGEPVALKTVRADLLVGSERDIVLTRFHQEAQIGMGCAIPASSGFALAASRTTSCIWRWTSSPARSWGG